MLLAETAVAATGGYQPADQPVDSRGCFGELEAADRWEKALLRQYAGRVEEQGKSQESGTSNA
jgi:hypothetical protein